jgi:very-short-patch-repair endonuclease
MPEYRLRNTRRARDLRNNATPAERALWKHLQGSKLDGHKFSRQIQIGPCYGDFVCRRLKVVVELDGFSHDLTAEDDARRTEYMERNGYRVVRFTNEDVLRNTEGVLAVLTRELADRPTPALRACPSRMREGR